LHSKSPESDIRPGQTNQPFEQDSKRWIGQYGEERGTATHEKVKPLALQLPGL
jgi:hypothetical protein